MTLNSRSEQIMKEWFRPFQPGPTHPFVSNRVVKPAPPLQPYIWCYWEIKTVKALDQPLNCRILSDGCVDIFLNLSRIDKSYIMGYTNTWCTYKLGHSFQYAGVRFLPGMFPFLFNTSASELQNSIEDLYLVQPTTARFLSQFRENDCFLDRLVPLFNEYFTKHLYSIEKRFDSRVAEALLAVYKKPVVNDIETGLVRDLRVSSRHLRRLFDFYVGDNLRSFSRVVRFQHYVNAQASAPDNLNEKLYFDSGYYDQSHLIRDFRAFTGDTPRKFFKSIQRS